MSSISSSIALEAMRLQNGYAFAVDTRDWLMFRTLFTPKVRATYADQAYDGMDDWLSFFVPFHDGCEWTRHEMSNHLVGEDGDGLWALCYGHVEWTMKSAPQLMNTAQVLYRDRLIEAEHGFVIAERSLSIVRTHMGVPLPDGLELPNSILSLVASDGPATLSTAPS